MILPNNLICLDIETTDLDEDVGSIVQLASIVVNKEFEQIRFRKFDMYIKPLNNHRNPEAMAVNKIDEEILLHATSLEETLILFESFCENDRMLASFGSCFDMPFLKRQYKKINRVWPFKHHIVDLKTIAIWELAQRDIESSSGLASIMKTLDIHSEGSAHNAMVDVKNAVNIIRHIKGR